ncbi:hypothetical protein BD309DRAFT_1017324 [Dichomitus squalens]|nr:hypothetical protein BD309DRAFT_1017324 [Dichomitus squalens]
MNVNVMNSPDYRTHDGHLKHLLDQRAARADLHGRFPSLSEFSDSPSLYSHPQFSPRTPDRSVLDGHPNSFRFPQSPRTYVPPLPEPRSPITDRERLNFPNASSLDLEDDPRSSSELNSTQDDDEFDTPAEPADDEPRISMYGPKMRFHSPAPWEEDDDLDAKSVVEEHSLPKRVKKKSESGKKGWPLSRGSSEARPSNESSRSGKGKQSFDNASTTSANGALAALAQASMSSTSLAMHQSPHSLRDKLSLPRLRSRTPSNVGHHDAFSPSNASPINRNATPPHADAFGDNRSVFGHSSSPSVGSSLQEYSHPYANPDLARAVDVDLPPPSPSVVAFGTSRVDSSATLTDTTSSSSMSQFRSTITLGLSPGTSTTSVNPTLNESGSSSSRFKGISSPMPVDKASLHPEQLSKLNGFQSPIAPASGASPIVRNRDTSQPGIPMGGVHAWEAASTGAAGGGGGGALKLISLEEAQAQARERSRSQTAHPTISSPFVASKPLFSDPDMDAQRAQGRARSSSAGGVKGRGMFESPTRYTPGDSPISGPTRQVGRKKSGFMRLFNGKERISPNSPPPPVPVFSQDAFAAVPPPPPPQYARPRQGSTHRVPVPPLSPPNLSDGASSPIESPSYSSGGSSGSTSGGLREQQAQLNVRRRAPDLSIVTSPSLSNNLTVKIPHTAPLSAGSTEHAHQHLTPTTAVNHAEMRSHNSSPNSAPPSKTEFVGLSIRPMSTLFTNDLKELASKHDPSLRQRPSLELDTGTPTTATTAISPLSPDSPNAKALGYGGRSSDEKSGHISIAHDDRDQSSVIQALQEQILSTRRAWQRQIWELEGQVRDLKAEVEELRAADAGSEFCAACGRGALGRPAGDGASAGADGRTVEELKKAGVKVGGVVNRPRARTGVGSRFAARD